jgi:hypothetical protein
MKICLTRAVAMGREGNVTDVVYVGDGGWDAQASQELGWRFIGIGETIRLIRESAQDTYPVFTDFRCAEAVLAAAAGP